LVGVVALFTDWQPKTALSLLAWLVLPLLALWLISLRRPTFTDRYLIWCAPAFYLLIGAGLVWLRQIGRALPLSLMGAMLILAGLNIRLQMTIPIKPQFHKASAYLSAQREPDALLLFQIPYNAVVLDYYYEPPLDPWAEAPYTNWRFPDGSYMKGADYVDVELRRIIQGYKSVWLIYSEAAMWDERALVKAWLDTQGELVDERHFNLVDLYHYNLPSVE